MRYASLDLNWNVIRRWVPSKITDVKLFFIPIIFKVAEQDFGVNVFAKAGSVLFDNIWTSCVSWAGTKLKAETEDMAIGIKRAGLPSILRQALTQCAGKSSERQTDRIIEIRTDGRT